MQNFTWQDIYNEAELLRASLKIYTKSLYSPRKGYSTSTDEKSLYDFAVNTKDNLNILHRKLTRQNYSYRPASERHITVNGKVKKLYLYPWEERIVDATLYAILCQKFSSYFSNQSFAYKIDGSGVDTCQTKIASYLAKYDKVYIIKRDLSSYFPSINHEVLKKQVDSVISDSFLKDLLYQRIEFPYFNQDGQEVTATQGIPFGTPIACWFANLYLTEIDNLFDKDPEIGYFRYADDFLIATASYEKAQQIVEVFNTRVVQDLKMSCKLSHTRNLILSKVPIQQDGFEHVTKFKHLGLEYRADKTIGLSRDKVRKILNLVKRKLKRTERKLSKLPDQTSKVELLIKLANAGLTEGLKSVAIVDYYLKHVTDEAQLALLDRYVAETILATLTGRGFKKSNFKIVSYGRLRQLGLVSLVHRRRLIRHGHIDSTFFILRNNVRDEAFREKQEKWKARLEGWKKRKQERSTHQ